jgi:hypothetical protein
MPLITQVADKDRQRASLYPYPMTPLLGAANFISTSIVVGILAYFIHSLRMDNVFAPKELIYVRASRTNAAQD